MDPNWKPLEQRLGPERCSNFMYMGRVHGINLYKHRISRQYLNLADDCRCFEYAGCHGFREIPFDGALARVEEPLIQIGESPRTAYDGPFRATRTEALRKIWTSERLRSASPRPEEKTPRME